MSASSAITQRLAATSDLSDRLARITHAWAQIEGKVEAQVRQQAEGTYFGEFCPWAAHP
ncbi:MAG: hypothetical protein HY000_25775 [Planctomycetes bacterium]|nr:hypothetical protein [Planctomycetota bacterium]